jgi:undecaprenyl-diphosphatase
MLLDWMNDYRTPFLDCLFLANTRVGSLFILFPLSSVFAVTLFLRNRRLDAWLIGLGLGGATLVTHVAKQFFSRPRPELYDALIPMPASWSFPSGHTTQIAAFSLCLGIVVFRSSSSSRLCWFVAMIGILLTASVSISRLYLQVHYPSDVLAGATIAILWVGGLYFLLNWIKGTSH